MHSLQAVTCQWWEEEELWETHTHTRKSMLEAGKTSEEKEHLNLIRDDENASASAVVEYDIHHPSQKARKLKSISHTDEHIRVRQMDCVAHRRKMQRRRQNAMQTRCTYAVEK